MALIALVFVFPIYVLFVVSLKPGGEVAQSPLAPPGSMYLENYAAAWREALLGRALVNSAIITVLSVVVLVLIGSLAAYALARRLRGLRYSLYLVFLLGLVLPMQLGMVPLYQFMRDINLLGTYTSVIFFHAGVLLPLTIFLYTGFLRALPAAYEEAALVDGASHFQAFWRVIFPLLRPVTGTVIILTAIASWNDFLTPLLYVGSTPQETLPVAIFSFNGEYAAQWGLIFAGLVIGILPMLVIYGMFQRYIIRGFAAGIRG